MNNTNSTDRQNSETVMHSGTHHHLAILAAWGVQAAIWQYRIDYEHSVPADEWAYPRLVRAFGKCLLPAGYKHGIPGLAEMNCSCCACVQWNVLTSYFHDRSRRWFDEYVEFVVGRTASASATLAHRYRRAKARELAEAFGVPDADVEAADPSQWAEGSADLAARAHDMSTDYIGVGDNTICTDPVVWGQPVC